MSLDQYKSDIESCSRCSLCKWVPLTQIRSWRFAQGCPAIAKYNFHAYSGSGKMIVGLSLLEGRSELDESVAELIYKCTMCGACDAVCKCYRDDIDLTDVLEELRVKCVSEGQLIDEHMFMVDCLKREDNVFGEPKSRRGDWADGLGLKDINRETVEVLFHAGCRLSYDDELSKVARAVIALLKKAGVDVGIAGKEEACCGGKAYMVGYRGELENYAEDIASRVRASGASVLVTACADCYSAFNYLYPKIGRALGIEVLHITEYLVKLIKQKSIVMRKKVPLVVTYHDPCRLGRAGAPFMGDWEGDKLLRPPQLKRTARGGKYDEPREILKSVPGLKLVEMERVREYNWCCGAGGGVLEAYPDFALWTASERVVEARETGAEAIVTACPWCQRSLIDAVAHSGDKMAVLDINEVVLMALGS